MSTQRIKEYFLVSIILVVALSARLYRINSPLADWHSWRQADTSAVTRRYLREGIDLLRPRYDDLSNIPSGRENPEGFRFVEFPLVNALTATLAGLYPKISVEIWGRLTSIFFSLGATLLMYLIGKEWENSRVGTLAALLFAVLPFNVYYHRTILPEVPMVFFSLFALFTFKRWIRTERRLDYVLSLGSLAISLLLKPYTLFLGAPMLYLSLKKWSAAVVKQRALWIYLTSALIPFTLWRLWAAGFPEGIPAYTWLLNGSGIRFRPAFFRWIFAERIGKLVMGYWGLIPFAIGVIRTPSAKTGWVFHWWLAGMLTYLTVFATGNVTHDYYQIFIIPVFVVFMAIGIDALVKMPKPMFSQKLALAMAGASTVFGIGFSWYHVRDYFNINHPEIVAAGEAASVILPPDAKVVAPYQGDTAFLYQIDRQGWPIGGEIERKIQLGATDYVSVNFDEETEFLIERCKPSLKLEQFTVISLRNCSL